MGFTPARVCAHASCLCACIGQLPSQHLFPTPHDSPHVLPRSPSAVVVDANLSAVNGSFEFHVRHAFKTPGMGTSVQ